MSKSRLRVLLVPDSTYWVTGTIAKSIARFNPWIEATIASGSVLDAIFNEQPELMHNFDLVHFTCPYASHEWLPRFRDLAPCITSHHHVTDWDPIKHNLDGDAIIVGSPEWAEDLSARGVDSSRVFCVPYGVDATLFSPAHEERGAMRQRLGFGNQAIVVGFFGKSSSNNDDRKGIDVFVSAALELNRRLKQLAVLIIGPGWQELSNSLAASGVRCVWIPFVRELKDLAPMYQALDFYWVTARVEGGPVTLLEAMSSEVCCLTTAVGIAREIVKDNDNALLVPFNDAQAFVDRSAFLVDQPDERRRVGREARKTILREMNVGVTATRVRAVYRKAFDNFARRQNQPIRCNVDAIANQFEEAAVSNRDGEIFLHGFPRDVHKRAKMLEGLVFAEHLLPYPKQRAVAVKMIVSEWLANPFSTLPIRVLLRGTLPTSWVSRVVKFKNRSLPKPAIVANQITGE
jgi:glycosyltransferase involved in cell wall biosynthesis